MYATTLVENQKKLWLPDNCDTQTITYNEHITISKNPLRRTAWEITKYIDTEPAGLVKLTLAQQPEYNPVDNLTWVNWTSENYSSDTNITGSGYDFYSPRYNDTWKQEPKYSYEPEHVNLIKYSGVKPSLKIGGGYKTFTSDLNIAGKPYWRIHYVNNDTNICTVKFKYNDDELVCDNALKEFVVTDKTKIAFGEQFGIQFKYNSEKPNELKIKCQSILNMLGGKFIIEAGNSQFTTYASLEVEVEGL